MSLKYFVYFVISSGHVGRKVCFLSQIIVSNFLITLYYYHEKQKTKKNYKRYDINKVDIYMKVFVLSSFILIKQKFFFC